MGKNKPLECRSRGDPWQAGAVGWAALGIPSRPYLPQQQESLGQGFLPSLLLHPSAFP